MMVFSLNSASKHLSAGLARPSRRANRPLNVVGTLMPVFARTVQSELRETRILTDGDKPVHARDASVQTFLTSWDVLAKLRSANCRQDTRICDSTHKQFQTGLKTWLLWRAYP